MKCHSKRLDSRGEAWKSGLCVEESSAASFMMRLMVGDFVEKPWVAMIGDVRTMRGQWERYYRGAYRLRVIHIRRLRERCNFIELARTTKVSSDCCSVVKNGRQIQYNCCKMHQQKSQIFHVS